MKLTHLVLLALTLASPVHAQQEPALKPGDVAPALSVRKWLKGEPVAAFQEGRIYVVEFWATWCGPCVRGMPHLTRLQRDVAPKGVRIIGVNGAGLNNTEEQASKFVEQNGALMGYTVGWDVERETVDAYLVAARRPGIPCCFVVDQRGRVAWIGHPMLLTLPLDALLAGTWDVARGAAEAAALEQRIMEGVIGKTRSEPTAALENLRAIARDYPKVAAQFDDVRFDLLLFVGRYTEAYAVATRVVGEMIALKHATGLNEIAWRIVDPEGAVEKKDIALALRAASKAVEFSQRKDAALLDTLARVHFLRGELELAIATQTEALALVADGPLQVSLQKALDEYRAARR